MLAAFKHFVMPDCLDTNHANILNIFFSRIYTFEQCIFMAKSQHILSISVFCLHAGCVIGHPKLPFQLLSMSLCWIMSKELQKEKQWRRYDSKQCYGVFFFFFVFSKLFLSALRGYWTSGPYLWRLFCIFSKNKATLDKETYGSCQKCSKELKNQFYFSRGNCCKVTVKNVRKSIFYMFWTINQ